MVFTLTFNPSLGTSTPITVNTTPPSTFTTADNGATYTSTSTPNKWSHFLNR
jgi:hypothetical protein